MDFYKRFSSVWKQLGESSLFVLATVNGTVPSARMMSGIICSEQIYFQSDSLMDKASEIRQNNAVAVCIEDIQIKGVCSECGHPLAKGNEWFAKTFRETYPKAFKKYTHIESEMLYKISPKIIKIWSEIEGIPCIEKLDVEKHMYDICWLKSSGK